MHVYPNGTFCFVCWRGETAEAFLQRLGTDGAGLPERDPDYQKQKRESRARYRPDPSLEARVEMWHQTLVDEESPRRTRMGWLLDRGLSIQTLRRWKLGHTGSEFTIPIWQGETLVGARLRLDPLYHEDIAGHNKYKPWTWGQPILVFRPNPQGKVTVITEGELDALLLAQHGYDSITTTGGARSLAEFITPESVRREPIVCVDNDRDGYRAYADLCARWGRELPRWKSEYKDISEAVQNREDIGIGEFIDRELQRSGTLHRPRLRGRPSSPRSSLPRSPIYS